MNTFLDGYIGGEMPDQYTNHSIITVTDTGLVFSERFYSAYTLSMPSYTYNDSTGNPQLHWQGCFLLDAKTLSPIENGDYTQSLGTERCDLLKEFFPEMISDGYNSYNSDFILSRSDSENEAYLLFARYNFPNVTDDKMDLYYSVLRYDTLKQSWYVYSKYNKFNEGLSTVYSVLQPIRHANGIDWWIIAGERHTNKWYTFLLDQNGIHLAQTSILEGWEDNDFYGFICASPDGQTILYYPQYRYDAGESFFFVADFDRCTGKITYRQSDSIPVAPPDCLSMVEISPNGRFAYLSTGAHIYQYDLQDINFKDSRVLVATWDPDLKKDYTHGLPDAFMIPFRANNGRIYFWAANTMPFCSKIEYPDRKGPDVGFVQAYIQTPINLPWYVQKFPDYGMAALPEPCPTNKNKETGVIQLSVFPNPVTSIIYLSGYPEGDNKRSQIIDNLGRVVWQGDTDSLNSGLEVSRLAAGVYVLSIDGLGVKKFVKG